MLETFSFHRSAILEGPLSDYPLENAALFFGNFEERSNHFDPKSPEFNAVNFLEVSENHKTETLSINSSAPFHKANMGFLKKAIDALDEEKVFIDVTGITHSVWAPLLKLSLEAKKETSLIYVEPKDYSRSKNPTGGYWYDLSEKTTGIAPIPGFASFPGNDDEDYIFVAFLGFEGPRFLYALEQLEPSGDNVIPIVGVPGYRPEYPFFSYEGNAIALMQHRYKAWKNVRFSEASCPFSAYATLEKIHKDNPGKRMKIGLLGTKPHAIGAILYRLANANHVELIYDHPIRKEKRTTGTMTKHIFEVGDFLTHKQEFKQAILKGRLR